MLLRRCFGLQHELLVLLMPEMIAKRYFRAVRDGTRDVVLRTVCEQILHDEEGHVAFHVDYLQKALSRLSLGGRVCLRAVWRLGFRLSCVAMIADHWRLLTAAKVSPTAFWWDCGLIFDEVAAAIFTCAPTPVMERMTLGFQLK
jgi:hypothetical protein